MKVKISIAQVVKTHADKDKGPQQQQQQQDETNEKKERKKQTMRWLTINGDDEKRYDFH